MKITARTLRNSCAPRTALKFTTGILALAVTLSACGGGSGFSSNASSNGASSAGSAPSGGLNMLIGSSGPAELASVKASAAEYAKTSGTAVTVNNASELTQQLSQGFTSGKPADVFYLSPDVMAGYVKSGALYPYGDQLSNKADFIPSLTKAFTVNGKFYCAPKDFSTLALIINTDAWTKAGLTDGDIPKTWADLSAVSKKLTNGSQTGLVLSGEYARVGAFMKQAGGSLLSTDESKATADSPENLKALQYVQTELKSGSFKFASAVGAGWGGEAFGKGLGAMTIEGNWIEGALKSDYPGIKYKVVELPAGPAGKGTLQFSNCWGIAAASKNKEAAVKLVEYLTKPDTQLKFAKDFGVAPSTTAGAATFKQSNPNLAAFINGAEYAATVPSNLGAAEAITDLNSHLETLATADPQGILSGAQSNFSDLLKAK